MVALTRDFHVFTSRVAASFSAVFLSARYSHKDTVGARTFSSLDSPLQFRPFEFRSTCSDLLKHCDS